MSIIYSKEKDGTLNVLVSGKVSREPELKQNAKGNKVKFSICYGKHKYMEIDAWADSDIGAMAGRLEKGDHVSVAGVHRAWDYDGKTYQSVTADMLFPLYLPASETQEYTPPPSTATYQELTEDDDDGDLPF